MILGLLETVGFNGSFSFDIWIDIQGRRGMGLVVLKVSSDYLEWIGKHKQNIFVWMRHGFFVVVSRTNEFLLEIFHLEEHRFMFIKYR